MAEQRAMDVGRVIWAGCLATMVMTLVMLLCTATGMPPSHLERLMASIFSLQTLETGSGIWWLAMLEHFMTGGVILPLLYVGLFHRFSRLPPIARGAAWGTLLWFVTESLMMPLAGLGLFGMVEGNFLGASLQSLVLHLIYGSVMGLAIGSREDLYVDSPTPIEEDRHQVELHF